MATPNLNRNPSLPPLPLPPFPFHQQDNNPCISIAGIPHSQTLSMDAIDRWEPYIITSRVESRGLLPRYNEVFTGRFFNKVAWISTLRSLGYRFYNLAPHFLVHKTHRLHHFTSSLLYTHHPVMMKAMVATVIEVRRALGMPWATRVGPFKPPPPPRPQTTPRIPQTLAAPAKSAKNLIALQAVQHKQGALHKNSEVQEF